MVFHLGDQIDAAQPCRLIAVVDRYRLTEAALINKLAVLEGQLAGQIQQFAAHHGGDVIGRWGCGDRKNDAQFDQACLEFTHSRCSPEG